MVLRMMMRWAESRGFKVELLEASAGEEAGIKSATFRAAGENAYGLFNAEQGVHRLVRISPFDAQSRRQTAFAGVEVAPVIEDTGDVEIDSDDLQIDTYRASGAGGQHVNKTDSAVRITHRPTGIVVQCQNERSQSANKETAMKMLRAKLLEREERERQEEIAKEKGETLDVNFGSQIRSYVLHPYTMVKDHRTDREMGDAQRVLDGDLDGFVRAYLLKAAAALVARERGVDAQSGPSEQPTAPYLDAVVAYGFRGPGRFHVPGHKGGPGRRPGPALRARRPRAGASTSRRTSTASTSARRRRPTSAPRRWPPRPTARRARGSSPTARRRATTRCASRSRRWARTSSRSATRTPRSSTGSCSAAALPSFVAPGLRRRAGHGARRHAGGAGRGAGRATPRRARRVRRLADLLRHGRRRRGAAREVAHARDVALVVDQSWGPHFGFHPDLPAERAGARAPTPC